MTPKKKININQKSNNIKKQLTSKKKRNSKHKRFKNFLKSGFDLKTVLQIITITIALTGLSITIWIYHKKTESEKTNLTVQMGIQPNPYKVVEGKYYYYDSWYLFMNNGSTTAKSAIISWFLNNKYIAISGNPVIMGTTHGATVDVIETSTPGFCELHVKDLLPGTGFYIGVSHRIKEEYADEIIESWKEHMFDTEFTKYFLTEINISGEKISIINSGAYNLENMNN